jgi:hypothetical protein
LLHAGNRVLDVAGGRPLLRPLKGRSGLRSEGGWWAGPGSPSRPAKPPRQGLGLDGVARPPTLLVG